MRGTEGDMEPDSFRTEILRSSPELVFVSVVMGKDGTIKSR